MKNSCKGSQYTFENYKVKDDNRSAFELAKHFAEGKMDERQCFIFGVCGSGKTHLLYAVRNYIKARYPELSVIMINSTRLIDDLRKMRLMELYQLYMKYDVILVDDIQVWYEKEAIRQDLISLFDDLNKAGKRIMITSSCIYCCERDMKSVRIEGNSISIVSDERLMPKGFKGERAIIRESWITIPVECLSL